MSKVATVQDSNGDVWTGKEESSRDTGLEMLGALFTCGASELCAGSRSATVSVNGEKHTGRRVK